MIASFIIKWHTRRIDNLLQTIRFLEKWHKNVIEHSELILLCHDKCSEIKTNFKVTKNYNLELKEMQPAKQTNFGIEKTSCDTIVLLDSDRIVLPNYYENILTNFNPNTMVSTYKLKKLTIPQRDQEISDKNYYFIEENRTISDPGTRCIWSGNVIFNKIRFYQAGGMDENYSGYGWEDNDMALTMLKSGIEPIMLDEEEIHLYHEPMTYGSKDQKKLFIQNGIYFCRKWQLPYPQILIEELERI